MTLRTILHRLAKPWNESERSSTFQPMARMTIGEFKRQVGALPSALNGLTLAYIDFDGSDPFLMTDDGGSNVEGEIVINGSDTRPTWLPEMRVHAMRHGYPLCRFTDKPPKEWDPNDTWVSAYTDQDQVTCQGCKHELPLPDATP